MKYVVDSATDLDPDIVDDARDVSVKLEGVPPAPPIWLIIPVGLVLVGAIYLATRK